MCVCVCASRTYQIGPLTYGNGFNGRETNRKSSSRHYNTNLVGVSEKHRGCFASLRRARCDGGRVAPRQKRHRDHPSVRPQEGRPRMLFVGLEARGESMRAWSSRERLTNTVDEMQASTLFLRVCTPIATAAIPQQHALNPLPEPHDRVQHSIPTA